MGLFALIHIRLCFVLYRLLACVIAVLWFQTLLNLSKIINDIVGKCSLKVFSFAISIGHTAGLCLRNFPSPESANVSLSGDSVKKQGTN